MGRPMSCWRNFFGSSYLYCSWSISFSSDLDSQWDRKTFDWVGHNSLVRHLPAFTPESWACPTCWWRWCWQASSWRWSVCLEPRWCLPAGHRKAICSYHAPRSSISPRSSSRLWWLCWSSQGLARWSKRRQVTKSRTESCDSSFPRWNWSPISLLRRFQTWTPWSRSISSLTSSHWSLLHRRRSSLWRSWRIPH